MNLRIRPGVAAVLYRDDGQILLHRRYVGDGWAPPSGAVEPGEDLVAAARRELMEETGLEVSVVRPIGIYSDPAYQVVEYPDGRRIHFVTSLFRCHTAGGEVRGSEEATAWEWFQQDNLPEGLLPYARVWLRDAFDRSTTFWVR